MSTMDSSDDHQGTECHIEDICEKLDTVNIHEDEGEKFKSAELHDEELFTQPPPADDCPICFLRLPTLDTGWRYMSCCGKVICSGCCHAPVYDNQGNEVDNEKCPFCRTPWPESDEEANRRDKNRLEAGDPIEIFNHGMYYQNGRYGFPQDYTKALELFVQAGEFGYADAYCNIGNTYDNGEGVEVDKEKAMHYYELSAMRGNAVARHNLGVKEAIAGNVDRAIKHFIISVRGGFADSLNKIKRLYSSGHATKDDYTKALRAYQTIWVRSRVVRGMKLLHPMMGFVTISIRARASEESSVY